MKDLYIFVVISTLLLGCYHSEAKFDSNEADSSASLVSTIQSLRIPERSISLTDLKIGVARKEIDRLFTNTPYDIREVAFGKLNSETQFLYASPVRWWGLDGELKIEFNEKDGKDKAITWTTHSLSSSDFEILTKLITKDLPDAINSKGVDHGIFLHSWKFKGSSYELIWHEASGRTELKVPATTLYYPL